ncbi:MAG: hypothetical protein AAFX76_04575, partial [Planctomycetota bacterium]
MPSTALTAKPYVRFDLSQQSWTVAPGPIAADVPAELAARLSGEIPATVPGCVHTDLLAAGLIESPYGYNVEPTLEWIGRCDWRYTCRFSADEDLTTRRHVELCCEGLDTVAALTLNGLAIGQTANMHRRYRFKIAEALRAGENELVIEFSAPLTAAEREEARYGALPYGGGGSNDGRPHNMLRKMACNFGWDWGPALTTVGVWRGIRLEAWDEARLGDVVPQVESAEASGAELAVRAAVVGDAETEVKFELSDPAGRVVASATQAGEAGQASARLTVDRPALWWPAGHGEQPLYTLTTRLVDAEGLVLDEAEQRIGLRTVAIDSTPDATAGDGSAIDDLALGERMHIKVNGRPGSSARAGKQSSGIQLAPFRKIGRPLTLMCIRSPSARSSIA